MAAMQNPRDREIFRDRFALHKNTGSAQLPDVDNVKGGALAAAFECA
jgi:hypothetical protein